MNEEELDVWQGNFKEAVEQVKNKKTTYIAQDVICLEQTADAESYVASPMAKKLLRFSDDIEIEIIKKGHNFREAHEALVEQETVGLIVLGKTIHRASKPALIALTTDKKLFIIDPNDKYAILFLKTKICDNRISFWTTNGKDEADCLFHNYEIDLARDNVMDCFGVHVHLMKMFKAKKMAGVLHHYPLEVTSQMKIKDTSNKIYIKPYDRLVEMWLGIDAEVELFYRSDQISHLNSRPLDMTAINIIKKRCLYVIPLARVLESYTKKDVIKMSRNIFSKFTVLGSSEHKDEAMRATLKLRQEGEVDPYYYSHLDDGLGDWRNGY